MALTIGTERSLAGPCSHTQGWTCCRQACSIPDQSGAWIGRPGLWKPRLDERGMAEYEIFDIPPATYLLSESVLDPDREDLHPLKLCRDWASATAAGATPRGWRCPSREQIEGWLPPGGWTIQKSTLARQVELLHRPDRLALRVAILPSIPGELADVRTHWLKQLLIEGHNHWRLVRMGVMSDSPGEAAVAEVDLTGCPPEIIESVIRLGLSALRWAVQWILEPAVFLADSRCECSALECV